MGGAQAAKACIVEHRSAQSVIGTFENVGVAIWKTATSLELVGLLGVTLRRLSRDYDRGIGLIQVVDQAHPPIGSDVRTELHKMLIGASAYVRCSTVVYEGHGFRAAAVRGIVTGLSMLARLPFPHNVFAAVPIAVEWQIAHLREIAPELRRDEMITAIETLRTQTDEPEFAITA